MPTTSPLLSPIPKRRKRTEVNTESSFIDLSQIALPLSPVKLNVHNLLPTDGTPTTPPITFGLDEKSEDMIFSFHLNNTQETQPKIDAQISLPNDSKIEEKNDYVPDTYDGALEMLGIENIDLRSSLLMNK